ncbi:MAG: ATP-binding protein, partial [Cyanobacteria bacterium J06576_12]
LIDCDGTYPADAGRETAIALLLESLSTPVLLSSNDKKPVLRRAVITVELPSLTYAEQTDLWQTSLGESAALPNGHVNGLATQFNLSPTAIRTACHQLRVSEPETGEEAASTLWHLCRAQARPNLDDLAQRIDAKATWEDLVLPDRQQAVLSDIATHLKQRSRVYQDWGFASKGDRGLGISALFYGESGTGKTMAAEVLANGCQLDLYRIDLSSVVSKYIGETEKNLRRIFDAAETGGAILLFDEADALFGKRSEVKDSRDRHANIEVSYLLQRMEAYQGLAILTSNLKDSIDKAFARRIRFMVQFPSPERAARAEIWRRIFPKAAPVRNLNYEKLGQLKIAGGNIRSIALSTAFIAAEEGAAIEMRHVYKAAQREYMKLERLLTTEETRDWEI